MKKYLFLCLGILIIIAGTRIFLSELYASDSAEVKETPSGSSISGQIKGEGGNPIAGAVISVLHQEGKTAELQIKPVQSDNDGKYLLGNLKEGKNCIRVDIEGYASEEKHGVMLKAVESITGIDFTLEKGYTISGKVKNEEGKTIDNATVGARSIGYDFGDNSLYEPETLIEWSDIPEVKTDKKGEFTLKGLKKGKLRYIVWAKSDRYAIGKVKNVGVETADIEIVLKLGGSVSGKVIHSATQKPVPNAKVSCKQGSMTTFSDCDGEGNFKFLGLKPGVYELSVHSDKLVSKTPKEIKIVAGEVTSGIELKLTEGLSLSGVVKEKETEKGIGKVNIELNHDKLGSYSAVTDSGGNYKIEGLGPGKCSIQVQSDEYMVLSDKKFSQPGNWKEVLISDKDIGGIDFELVLGGSISGDVVNPRGEALSGATINLKRKPTGVFNFDFTPPETKGVKSDENGKFTLKTITPGSGYIVIAGHPDYAQGESQAVDVKSGEDTGGIRIVMTQGGSISGRVTSVKDEAIEGAIIKASLTGEGFLGLVSPSGTEEKEGVKSNIDGKYIIPNLSRGKYTISAQANGYATAIKKNVEVREKEDTSGIDIVLSPGNSISGMVTNESGTPISGANIWAHSMDFDSMGEGKNASTDDEGRYRINGLGKGSFNLSCSANGYGSENKPQVPANSTDVNFVLRKEGIISGHVISKVTSGPITSFVIRHTKEMKGPFGGHFFGPGKEFHSEEGEFKIELEEGNYTLEARADGFAPGIVHDVKVKSGNTTDGITIRLDKGGSIAGYVLSGADKLPISDAKVWVNQGGSFFMMGWMGQDTGTKETRTKSEGSFLLEDLTPGNISISASHANYPVATVTGIQVIVGQTTTGIEILLSTGGRIEGHVYNEENKPFSGAMIMAQPMDMREMSSMKEPAVTNEQGYYKIENLKPGTYQVVKMDEKFFKGGMEFRQVNVKSGETVTIDFGTRGGCRLYGVITHAGKPASGFNVMVLPKDYLTLQSESASVGMGMTDDQGFYEIKNLSPGEYELMLQEMGMKDESQSSRGFEIQIRDVSEMEYNIDLSGGATLIGTVLTASQGLPIDGADVILTRSNKDGLTSENIMATMSGSTKTDADGRFQFKGVQDGTYGIGAMKDDFSQEAISPINVTGGIGPTDLVIRLSQGGTIVGTITDRKTGFPISGAYVSDQTDKNKMTVSWKGTNGFTDATGRYTISGIKAGTCKIIAWAERYGQAAALVQVVDGQKTNQDFSLSRGGTATFVVSDDTGSPISGAAIEIKDGKGEKVEYVALMDFLSAYTGSNTDAEGKSVWGCLGEGEYAVTVSKSGFKPASEKFSIQSGEDRLVKIILSKE